MRHAACPERPLTPPEFDYRCPVCGAAPFETVYCTRGGVIRGCDQCLCARPPEEAGCLQRQEVNRFGAY